jgi:hypothetical protein
MGKLDARSLIPVVVTGIAFAVLFAQPFLLLLDDWWNNPEAGHGLLLAPVALWLAWRSRSGVAIEPNRGFGTVILIGAVLLRYLSGLGAELFTMRSSMVFALIGLVVYFAGEPGGCRLLFCSCRSRFPRWWSTRWRCRSSSGPRGWAPRCWRRDMCRSGSTET